MPKKRLSLEAKIKATLEKRPDLSLEDFKRRYKRRYKTGSIARSFGRARRASFLPTKRKLSVRVLKPVTKKFKITETKHYIYTFASEVNLNNIIPKLIKKHKKAELIFGILDYESDVGERRKVQTLTYIITEWREVINELQNLMTQYSIKRVIAIEIVLVDI